MRRLSLLIVITMVLLSACKSKKANQVTVTSEDGKEKVSVDMNKMESASAEMQKKSEELQKLPPLSLDQLKALVPEELAGGKKTSYNATAAMGTGVANAEYKIDDTTNVRLTVYDCAGTGGAGIYSMQYLGMFNMESESETEYTKTIDFNGGKAFERCRKDRNDCTLTYFSGDRFLVTLDGSNVGIDALKQAANSLNIK